MEKMPTARERFDNFEQNKLKKEAEEFEKAVYGETAGIVDFSDEAKARLEEGLAYEEHLKTMSERPEHDPLEIFDQNKAQADYQETMHQQQLAEQEQLQKHRENQDDPRVEGLMSYAQQIGEFKQSQKAYVEELKSKYEEGVKHGLAVDFVDFMNADPQYQSMQKQLLQKEDLLNDRLFELSEQDGEVFTDQIINEIIDATDREAYLQRVADWKAAREVDNAESVVNQFKAYEQGKISKEDLARAVVASFSSEGDGFAVAVDQLQDENDPSLSDKIVEKIRKSPFYKKTVAIAVMLLTMGGGLFSGGNSVMYAEGPDLANNNQYDNTPKAQAMVDNPKTPEVLEGLDINFNNGENAEVDQGVNEKITSYDDFLASQEYANHKPGDDIEYDYEVGTIIDNQRDGKFDMFPGIKGETAGQKFEYVKKASYYSPELVASLAMHELAGFELKYIDANGNEAIARTPDQINQSVDQMKNNPDLFGKNYDAFLDIVENAEFGMTSITKGTFNVYKYIDRTDSKEKLAIGQGGGGDALQLTLDGGDKLIYLEHCANVIVLKMHKKTTLLIPPDEDPIPPDEDPIPPDENPIPPDEDPTPETPPEIPPETPETPPIVPPIVPPITPPETPPETIVQPKDPSLDINVNPNLSDQDKMGDQRVDSGGLRPSEDVTENIYQAPSAPENTVDQQKMTEAKQEIEKNIENLNNSYNNLSSQEKATIEENQTGVGEVNKSYEEVAQNAQPIETTPQPGQSQDSGVVTGEVDGF